MSPFRFPPQPARVLALALLMSLGAPASQAKESVSTLLCLDQGQTALDEGALFSLRQLVGKAQKLQREAGAPQSVFIETLVPANPTETPAQSEARAAAALKQLRDLGLSYRDHIATRTNGMAPGDLGCKPGQVAFDLEVLFKDN
jgi:hypothetical protein